MSTTSAIRDDALDVFSRIVTQLDTLNARLDTMQEQINRQRVVVAFAERRPAWTVIELATDLNVSEQTIRNYLALPDGHSAKLHSFQPSAGAPHRILAEHVADWLERGAGRVSIAAVA